jgi:hypothetical protein
MRVLCTEKQRNRGAGWFVDRSYKKRMMNTSMQLASQSRSVVVVASSAEDLREYFASSFFY